MALGKITRAVDENYRGVLRGIKTAKEAWEALTDHYEKKSVDNRIVLRDKLLGARMKSGQSMEEHINKMLKLADQLQNAGGGDTEEQLVGYILRSLPPDWASFASTLKLLNKDKIIDVKDALIREATVRNEARQQESEDESRKETESANVAARFRRPPTPFTARTCFVCGSGEHLIADCKDPRKKARKQVTRLQCFVCGGPHAAVTTNLCSSQRHRTRLFLSKL
jgi:hypothetical protein